MAPRYELDDDNDQPACVDCALGRCTLCRDDDPRRLGERECCCGNVADVKVYPARSAVR